MKASGRQYPCKSDRTPKTSNFFEEIIQKTEGKNEIGEAVCVCV